MDLYSGRFPLDRVTLCLDMSSEELSEVNPSQPIEASEKGQSGSAGPLACTPQIASEQLPNEKPGELSQTPTSASSSSAAESSSESEGVMINPHKGTAKEQTGQKEGVDQDSEGEQLSVVVKPAGTGLINPADYFTDTSDQRT